MVCLIASTLFGLAILILVVIQTVLQMRILRELRKQTVERRPQAGNPPGPAPTRA